MASQFTVTPSSLRQKASDLRSSNRSFTTDLNNLRNQKHALDGMWDGDAKQAFDRAFNHDIQQMQEFYNAVEDYVRKLDEIARNYEQTERRNVSVGETRVY